MNSLQTLARTAAMVVTSLALLIVCGSPKSPYVFSTAASEATMGGEAIIDVRLIHDSTGKAVENALLGVLSTAASHDRCGANGSATHKTWLDIQTGRHLHGRGCPHAAPLERAQASARTPRVLSSTAETRQSRDQLVRKPRSLRGWGMMSCRLRCTAPRDWPILVRFFSSPSA